jgi:hypothetical protein
LSLVVTPFSLSTTIDFPAVRHVPLGSAVGGHPPAKHVLFDSSQFCPPPHGVPLLWQTPFWQASVPSQNKPSSQFVPFGLNAFGGQLALLPVQCSATSHTPAAARHTVLDGLKPSGGHVLLLPLHVSATSQNWPAEAARQTVPAGLTLSVGQLGLLPVQTSVASQASPALAARQIVPAGAK